MAAYGAHRPLCGPTWLEREEIVVAGEAGKTGPGQTKPRLGTTGKPAKPKQAALGFLEGKSKLGFESWGARAPRRDNRGHIRGDPLGPLGALQTALGWLACMYAQPWLGLAWACLA